MGPNLDRACMPWEGFCEGTLSGLIAKSEAKGLSINKTVNLAFGVVDFVDLAKWCSSSPRGKNGGQG